MAEIAKLLEPGFSTVDAEFPRFEFREGTLTLDFLDWQERAVRVWFLEAAGVKWQELDFSGPQCRDDSVYEMMGSSWIAEYMAAGTGREGAGLRHFRLCFNARGVLDVLATSMHVKDAD